MIQGLVLYMKILYGLLCIHLLYFFFVLHCFPYVHAMCNKRRDRNAKRHLVRLYSLGVQPTAFLKNLVKWACDEKPNA